MKRIFLLFTVLILVLGFYVFSGADLIDMGDQTVYDTDLQISWLKDAEMGGIKTWWIANLWAEDLVFAGFDNWRLPIVTDQTSGLNITGSEMGDLYYIALGNTAGQPVPTINTEPFDNLYGGFWSGTEYELDLDRAWAFCFNCGNQFHDHKYDTFHILAVRPGERTPPALGLDPLEYDFGYVTLGNPATMVVTISNSGGGILHIEEIELEGSSIFTFSLQSPLPFALSNAQTMEVEITCDPSILYGKDRATLEIELDSEQEDTVSLTCAGRISDDPLEEIQGLIMYILQSIEEWALIGQGGGNSADNRLNTFIDLVETAGQLIDDNNLDKACDQLIDIYERVDGDPKPKDFVAGENSDNIARVINYIITNLQCLEL